MNILYIVPYVPDLVRVRPYNLIANLTALGHRVSVATLWSNKAEQAALVKLKPHCHQIYAKKLSRWQSYLSCALSLPGIQPLQASFCWQPQFARELAALIQANPGAFDAIHVEHLRGARYGLFLKSAMASLPKKIPIVWDSVDCITHLFRQASQKSRSIRSRLLTGFEANRTAHYEGWLTSQFDKVLVTSKIDRQAFETLQNQQDISAEITVLPNGVDLQYFKPNPSEVREPATLVLSGKMSYHANIAMALHLVNDILPIIWAEYPAVKLWIVGKDPPDTIRVLANNPSISVTGTVADIRPYLHKTTLAVAPITYGAGIQNKVLEAMACGTPVVTTSQAVSALSILPNHHLLVADRAEEFAKAVIRILRSPVLQRELGSAGRKYVEKNHNWAQIAANLAKIYQDVCDTP